MSMLTIQTGSTMAGGGLPFDLPLLSDENVTWDERSVPLARRGVSFSWLLQFARASDRGIGELWDDFHEKSHRHGNANLFRPDGVAETQLTDRFTKPPPPPYPEGDLTVRDFVSSVVIPVTRGIKAPLYAKIPPEYRGEPSMFISHTWDSNMFGQFGFIGAMTGTGHPDPGFVWIDFACYNQHRVESVAGDMMSIVSQIGTVAFALTERPFWSRLWCLWELMCAHRSGAQIQVRDVNIHTPKYAAPRPDFTSITDALASKQEDRRSLVDEILAVFGSIKHADNHVRKLLAESGVDHGTERPD